MRTKRLAITALVALLLMVPAAAQEAGRPMPPDPNASYKLDYTIYELEDGKRVNSRTYTLLADDGGGASTKMGMRVPLHTDKGVQYMDVGLHIEAKVRQRENQNVWVSTRFELGGLVSEAANPGGGAPAVRNIEYSVPAVVTPGKATVIAGGDDLSSKRKFQLELVVTKLK